MGSKQGLDTLAQEVHAHKRALIVTLGAIAAVNAASAPAWGVRSQINSKSGGDPAQAAEHGLIREATQKRSLKRRSLTSCQARTLAVLLRTPAETGDLHGFVRQLVVGCWS